MKNLNSHFYYSKSHEELISELCDNDALKLVKVTEYGHTPPDLIKEYKYEYGSWPVIISQERVSSFTEFFNQFKILCYKAVLNYFKSKEMFGEYLESPSFLFDFLGEISGQISDYVFRYDVIFSGGYFKILEVNTGSNIGGWQLDLLSESYLGLLKEENFSRNWNVNKEDILENVFKMVIKSIKSLKNPGQELNVVSVTQHEYQHDGMNHIKFELSRIFAKVKEELSFSGELIWCNNLSELQVDASDCVYLNGKGVSAVLVQYAKLENSMQSTMMQLTKSYLKGKLVFPDSPFHSLLGNKNILSLLYDAINGNIFDEEEVKLIKKHVPWTHKSGNDSLYKNHTAYKTRAFLRKNKDSLVLKKSLSMKGKDVYVGKFMSEADWHSVVKTHVKDSSWLIQEYCPPDQALMCDQNGWIGPYDFVWGIFDMDFKYSGAFIRGNRANCGNGVINSAGGAIEFTVFEEEKLKRVMSI